MSCDKPHRVIFLPVLLGLLFGAACNQGGTTVVVGARNDGSADRFVSPIDAPDPGPGFSILLDAGDNTLDVPEYEAGLCPSCAIDATPPAECGNGILELGEQCDDGNAVPGDGCSGLCAIEPGYVCSVPGRLCVLLNPNICGNGIIEPGEACDDGNARSLDGCSSACVVEAGWYCPEANKPCRPIDTPPVCGNSKVEGGESCDDGNTVDGDGCSSTCKLEVHWNCPQPGKPCVPVQYCGDGLVQPTLGEVCDDGNAIPGDGCSGSCKQIEPGYQCPPTGGKCTKIWVCGNAIIDPGEACDDGNTVASDGCTADCTTVEPGWTCPKGAKNTGGPCTRVPTNVCGNGILGVGETCDDGNTTSGDGCSSNCAIEAGWTCPTAGKACKLVEICGDGNLDLDILEECDDGNTVGGDGCSPNCTLEPNFVCPTPGHPCVSTVRCGDGKIGGNEQCDDGDTISKNGCSSTCQLEPGWTCPVVGTLCTAKACGDGILAGSEKCDDGNTIDGDGCSPTCQLNPGFNCGKDQWHPSAASTECYAITCGDGHKEGLEQCDDGNLRPFDGCSPGCTNEPKCGYPNDDTTKPYKCFSVCGDGIKMPDEACDDGNLQNGDGCSSTCTIEIGYACTAQAPTLGDSITVPILYRDFNWTHPQFEVTPQNDARLPGIASNQIGVNGKPVFNPAYGSPGRPWTMDGPTMGNDGPLMTDAAGQTFHTKAAGNAATLDATQVAANYAQWYTDDPNATGNATVDAANPLVTRITVQSTLTLNRVAAGTYQYYSSTFFPLDGEGFGNISWPGGTPHNYSFTSEGHYWFQYNGGEQLEFRGDDDVWVFVNGQLSVDLGGIHNELRGIVTLNGAATTYCVDNTSPGGGNPPPPTNCTTVPQGFGLVQGNIYEIIVFQAERHITNSNYKLTLRGFNAPKSVCHPVCGDGIVSRGEACDLGTANNTGAYGTCNPDCTLPPRCGDSIVQTPPEQCDDGVNLATYGGLTKKCGPSCKWAPYCGDGIVSNGEQCDEGIANGSGYGHCTAVCAKGPRCGDGIKNGPEQCDDGANNGTPGDDCSSTCTILCGNGVIDPGEQCDNGTAKNTGLYGACTPGCTLAPFCGDGIKNGPEQCDDGLNDGSYGTCMPGCLLPAPYCGDGIVNGSETCDLGILNNPTAYGSGKCTDQCMPAPFCGDHQVQYQFGETCDDGVNSGLAGSCTKDCKAFVPPEACGDGVVKAPEQCDDGLNNGTQQSKCDIHCRFKCGNGVKDPGEDCDNGVNNGAYGTCNADCTLGPHCGDGIKNGPEQCDFGAANVPVSTAYGTGLCTSVCTWAPYCGDGRIQTKFNEQCDGGDNCSAQCQKVNGIPIPIPIF